MANSDKNILITTNKNQAGDPSIVFTGGDNTPVTLTTLSDGTLTFSGVPGQLLAITNDMSGTIFSVNDVTGVPSIEIDDTGLTKISPYGTPTYPVLIGQLDPTSGVSALLQVNGAIRVGGAQGYTLPATDGNSGQVMVTNGSGTLTFTDQSGGGGGGASDETALFYAIAFGQF